VTRLDSQRRGHCRLIALAGTALVLAGCQPKNQFVAPPPPQVTVAQAIEKPVADSIEFVGRTEATGTVDLRARVNGYLEKVLFEDGATVKAGDLLFVIQQAPYKIALDAAQAELERAEATLELAKSEYARIEPLVAQNAVTQAELDAQDAQVKTSEAGVALAQSALERAKLDLSYTEIRAPISGHIGRHLVDVGNLIKTEETPLAIIQSIDPIYAYFDLSELDLLRFMEMLRKHELPDPSVTPPVLYLGLANEKGFPHEGKLDFRELGVDPGTGTTMRRGIFPNPDGQLIPGLFARIHAAIGEPVPKLLVEDRAVGSDQRGDFLLVVNDKNVVEYRPVKLGLVDGTMRVIEDGIKPTDLVIVNGIQRARPGVVVNPQRVLEGAEAAPPAGERASARGPQPAAPAPSAASPSAPAKASPEKPGG
jgi:RND family efflux transporter MFP subunit